MGEGAGMTSCVMAHELAIVVKGKVDTESWEHGDCCRYDISLVHGYAFNCEYPYSRRRGLGLKGSVADKFGDSASMGVSTALKFCAVEDAGAFLVLRMSSGAAVYLSTFSCMSINVEANGNVEERISVTISVTVSTSANTNVSSSAGVSMDLGAREGAAGNTGTVSCMSRNEDPTAQV